MNRPSILSEDQDGELGDIAYIEGVSEGSGNVSVAVS